MADETPPEPPTTVTPTPPSWDVNLQNMLKALMQGQRQPGQATETEDTANPFLQPQAAATPYARQNFDVSNLPAPVPHVMEVGAPYTKVKTAEAPKPHLPPPTQIPIQSIMQMGQFQMDPAVELAKQRVVQMLMQRPHGVVPQAPVAKG